jgi:hypothetical protein
VAPTLLQPGVAILEISFCINFALNKWNYNFYENQGVKTCPKTFRQEMAMRAIDTWQDPTPVPAPLSHQPQAGLLRQVEQVFCAEHMSSADSSEPHWLLCVVQSMH